MLATTLPPVIRWTRRSRVHTTEAEPKPSASPFCVYGIAAPPQTRTAAAPGNGATGGGSGSTLTLRRRTVVAPTCVESLELPARGWRRTTRKRPARPGGAEAKRRAARRPRAHGRRALRRRPDYERRPPRRADAKWSRRRRQVRVRCRERQNDREQGRHARQCITETVLLTTAFVTHESSTCAARREGRPASGRPLRPGAAGRRSARCRLAQRRARPSRGASSPPGRAAASIASTDHADARASELSRRTRP